MKAILDATAGGRMMWFDKEHPNAIYLDKRWEPKGCIPQQSLFSVEPSIRGDFTRLPYRDGSFKLVVFDPPHAEVSESSITGIKYGTLGTDWVDVISGGLSECYRVLADYGVLVFKWNEVAVSIGNVLSVIDIEPLFGHTTAKSGKTKWMLFMKIPGPPDTAPYEAGRSAAS